MSVIFWQKISKYKYSIKTVHIKRYILNKAVQAGLAVLESWNVRMRPVIRGARPSGSEFQRRLLRGLIFDIFIKNEYLIFQNAKWSKIWNLKLYLNYEFLKRAKIGRNEGLTVTIRDGVFPPRSSKTYFWVMNEHDW